MVEQLHLLSGVEGPCSVACVHVMPLTKHHQIFKVFLGLMSLARESLPLWGGPDQGSREIQDLWLLHLLVMGGAAPPTAHRRSQHI